MNPETRLCWHPLSEKLTDLKRECLLAHIDPPHWERVENIAAAGTPDLSWAWTASVVKGEGWIELKYRQDWPVREETPVSIDTITPHQRLWWRERWKAGGNVFVLLRIAESYLLFRGDWAALHLGKVDRATCEANAVFQCLRRELNPAILLSKAVR